jgi:hypothetical protein
VHTTYKYSFIFKEIFIILSSITTYRGEAGAMQGLRLENGCCTAQMKG